MIRRCSGTSGTTEVDSAYLKLRIDDTAVFERKHRATSNRICETTSESFEGGSSVYARKVVIWPVLMYSAKGCECKSTPEMR